MIGIIGGGVSGLSLAYYLHKQQTPYVLLEARDEVGGVIRSRVEDKAYTLELGPNSLLCDQDMRARLKEFGLSDRVIEANEVSKDRYIYKKGKYRKLPSSPPSLLFNRFFSWRTKWAILKERSNSTHSPDKETLASFFRRRFSDEIVDYALDPFIAGIYAGDPEKLLIEYTFPQLLAYEREHGSIIKGLIKNKTGSRKQSVSFKEGMQELTDKMSEGLNIVLNAPVEVLESRQAGQKQQLKTPKGTWEVDQVVIATPSGIGSKLLANIAPDYAAAMAKIRYAPMTAVHTAFSKSAVGRPPNGFGGLHPRKEGLFTAGQIWSSSVFDGKCPKDEVLFTSFVGGDQSREKGLLAEEEIKSQVAGELKELYRIQANPTFQASMQWEEALPQYDEALIDIYKPNAALEEKHIYICANWKGGVSIPDCIRKGEELAGKLK